MGHLCLLSVALGVVSLLLMILLVEVWIGECTRRMHVWLLELE